MRKFLIFLFLLCALLTACTAFAEANLPDGIEALLQGSAWDGYTIGRVNYGKNCLDYNSDACRYYDEHGSAAAFVLMTKKSQNVLCVFEKNKSGAWYLEAKSSKAVLQGERIPMITSETYGQFWVSYLDENRKVEKEFMFERRGDGWYLAHAALVDASQNYIAIDVYENKMVFSDERSGWKKTTVYGVTTSGFEQFSISAFPYTIQEARKSLSLPPQMPTSYDAYALPEPQVIKFAAQKKYPVYSGPDEGYLRAAEGKASVSTNDWVQVFGKEDGWIMIQYDITSDHMRIGWIEEAALPKNASVPSLFWQGQSAWLTMDATITDDPLFSKTAVLTLPKGAWVTALSTLGDWVYIESSTGDLLRGFVKRDALRYDRVFALEDFSERQATGTLTLSPDGRVSLDMAVNMGSAPASFLLKDVYTGYEIGKTFLTPQGRYTLEGTIPSDVASVSFIPVNPDGTQADELFRIEW